MPLLVRSGASVCYEVEGDGPPLFLLVGAGGDGSAWRREGYIAQLSGDYRCIAVDPRGFGRSSRPLEPEAMRVEELAGDVVAIADELGLERFALWGHSAGAYRAYAVAVAEPSRVTAVVGHGGPPPLSEPEWGEWRDQEFADSIRAGNDVVDLVRQNFPDEFPVRLEEELRSADPETLACLIERHLGERFQASWLKLKPPRLLLLGEEETTPEWVERARSALSNTDIAVLPNLGHISGFLASDEAVQAVRPFLARVEAEASAGTGQIHR